MKSIGMALDLREGPEVVAKYKEYHRAIWPEVKAGLRAIGISKMNIFLLDQRLFMYMKVSDDFDLARDFPRYMESARAKEWDELMRSFQQKVPEAGPDEWWAAMEEVFDLDW